MSATELRQEYMRRGLSESDLDPDPIRQFDVWMKAALAANLMEPHAMTLATATPEGRPSARLVLLRGYDARGFVFYTNYDSRKGRELQANPWAALVFFWVELERQVRIEGPVAKVSIEESDAYFQTRPKESRLGAWISAQSEVIPSRDVLEQRLAELAAQYPEDHVPLPPNWGGCRVAPHVFEFWQGRPYRLHDRLRYRKVDETWIIERLSP